MFDTTKRDPDGPETPAEERWQRRRASWSELRGAYPRTVGTMAIALLLLLGIDGWLLYHRARYVREIDRLRSGMTEVERRRADLALADRDHRLRVMLELVRRQAQGDRDLHLSVAVDSGRMYLEREGATLREMHIDVGAERTVGAPPDTVRIAAPRGARTVERVLGAGTVWEVPEWVYVERRVPIGEEGRSIRGALGAAAVVLNGGTVLYAMPATGPLSDSSYVLPGSVRLRATDLKAILPNLAPGTTIYFY